MGCTFVFGSLVAISLVTVGSCYVKVQFTKRGGEYLLQTPRYPFSAPRFTNIVWRLTAPEDQKIVLTCDDIRLLKRMRCSEGSLTVWDGASQHNICNVLSHYHRESKDNLMYVQFRSGWLGIGQARCRAKSVKKDTLDLTNFSVEDSREIGKGYGSKETTCPCGWTNRERIVGGRETGINEYPFVVSLILLKDRQRFCGGAIITPYHVVTAAHCIYRINEALGVVIGEHDFTTEHETNATETIRVRHIIQHEKYVHSNMVNDIALLILARKIEFNKQVGPVCMPSMKYDLLHKYVKVLGWGLTTDGGRFSDTLQKVDLKVIELEKCASQYENFIDLENPKQICTHGEKKDSCQGDSGGPVIHHEPQINSFVQIGLVSYGKECASDVPAVNTDVYAHTNWIETHINKHQPPVNTCEMIN
ncbi:venom serine protease [Halyomorpha halys]|uniref:venom serine protease n=1 Tax=Halyomorpha halys TaxID=286706 RepID=UPI0006D50A60|nr:venom serine protease-like [Halyomorpha halys]